MSPEETMVIAGAGLAGAKAAETLRTEGFGGRIVLVGDEPVRPYERPPLSKAYLRGEDDFDAAAVHDADFYAKHDIELRTSTTVTALHPGDSEVELDGGEQVRYERLLLATGASPRRLPIAGADLPGVYTLRNLATAEVERTTDPGRALITGKWKDIGRFKGPTLRGLASRAPYFHNGSAAQIEDVISFYDARFQIGLTEPEKADLLAFLSAL